MATKKKSADDKLVYPIFSKGKITAERLVRAITNKCLRKVKKEYHQKNLEKIG